MTIGTKLRFAFLTLIVLSAINTAINIVRFDEAQTNVQQIVKSDYPSVRAADNLASEINFIARPLRNIIIYSGPAENIRQNNMRKESEQRLEKYLSQVKSQATSPEQQTLVNTMEKQLIDFTNSIDLVFNLMSQGQKDQAIEYMTTTVRDYSTKLSASTQKVGSLYDTQIKQNMATADEHLNNAKLWGIILLIIITLASIILSWIAGKMVTKPLNIALEASNKIAAGDFSVDLSTGSKDEFATLLGSLDNMRNTIMSVLNDAKELGRDAVAGRLDRRADTSKLNGEYKELVESINYTLDAVINPLNITAEYIDRLSKGDIPPRIVDEYKGDFNEIKNNLNAMISTFEAYVNENQRMYKAQVAGDIDEMMDSSKFIGVFRTMSEGTNTSMKLHIDNLLLILDILKDYADGDITRDMKRLPGKQIIANQVMDKLKANLLDVIAVIKKTSMDQAAGDLDANIDTTKFKGAFLEMTSEFNACVNQIHSSVEKILTMAARYGDGDLSEALVPLPGKQVVGNIALDALRNNLLAVTKELDDIVKEAKAGKLHYRGNEKAHKGAYGQIVSGLNELLDTLVEPFNIANDYIGRISEGNIPKPIEKKFNGDFGIIVNSLNKCINTMNGVLNESELLIGNLSDGNLAVNANSHNFLGAWKDLINSMNGIIFSIKAPIEDVGTTLKAIAVNDYTRKIEGQYKGEWANLQDTVNEVLTRLQYLQFIAHSVSVGDLSELTKLVTSPKRSDNDQLRPAFINMMQAIKGLVDDTTKLAEEIQIGNLSYRADESKHPGQYGDVIAEVNKSINTMHNNINVSLEFLQEVSAGNDLPVLDETAFKGDNVHVARGINKLRNFLYSMIADTTGAAQAAIDGDLNTRIDLSKYPGGWNLIVSGFDNALNALTNQFHIALEFLDKVADGAELKALDETGYKGEFKTMVGNINRLRNFLYDMIGDTAGAAKAVANGKLREASINVSNYPGGWGEITGGFNDALKAMAEQFDLTSEFLGKVAQGEDLEEINTNLYHGQFKEMAVNINRLRNFLYVMIEDTQNSAKAAVAGNLALRLDLNKYPGGWGVITGGFNDTLEAMVKPIEEAITTLEVMATGDLAAKMCGEYNGDHEKLKNSINKLGEELSSLIVQVLDGVETAASAAVQISASAEVMSSQSHEQSAQTEQVASAVEEMSRTITENAHNAVTTTNVAKQNGSIAREGGEVVELTVKKMMDIAAVVKQSAENIEKLGHSSKQIGEIISVIDDIADQTNLLALNAAIEAARAGEQGRGFAVVADEVRKLAERTTEATKTISSMIISIQDETTTAVTVMQNGNHEVEEGILLADRAGKALSEIMHSSDKVIDMINQIASANEQQAATSEQLTQNITLISSATSESAQKIQEVAQSSDDLSKLTEDLRSLMDNFKIDTQMALRDGKILTSMNNPKKLLQSSY